METEFEKLEAEKFCRLNRTPEQLRDAARKRSEMKRAQAAKIETVQLYPAPEPQTHRQPEPSDGYVTTEGLEVQTNGKARYVVKRTPILPNVPNVYVSGR